MNLQSNTKERDGNYVKSIVAMMNDAEPAASPSPPSWMAATKETTPPRTPPSYLSVSRSNNGYNNTLLYSIDHRKETTIEPSDNHVNGNGTEKSSSEKLSTQYVSLSQMIGAKTKVNSKYSDLGLQLKSPEKNCRSFLRNINSFEMIGKQKSSVRSPDGHTVTMVGQKMQHLLHLDPPNRTTTESVAPPVIASLNSTLPPVETKEEDIDVPDRALTADPQIIAPLHDLKSSNICESFSNDVLKIVGLEEPNENFETPPNELAGQHFRKIATEQKERLLTLAIIVDKRIEADNVIPDEMQGIMRCASGKANLIVRERFRQFDELCETNLTPKAGQMTPGPADLAGFWDMVMIEVNSIFTSFRDIAKAATMNWTMPPKETVTRPVTSNTTRTVKKSPINKKTNVRRAPSADPNKKGPRPQR